MTDSTALTTTTSTNQALAFLHDGAALDHPTPVSERPWEREGWCDSQGRCWLGSNSTLPDVPAWIYGPAAWAERFPDIYRLLLPADAMPVPATINP